MEADVPATGPTPLQELVGLAEQGHSLEEIGRRVGLSRAGVSFRLRRAGYAIRTLRDRRCAACGAVMERARTTTATGRHWCIACVKRGRVEARRWGGPTPGPFAVRLRALQPPRPSGYVTRQHPEILPAILACQGRLSRRATALAFGLSPSTVYRLWTTKK